MRGRRRITTETGLRLSCALGTSERSWINVQADYDIEVAHDTHEDDLNSIESLVSRWMGQRDRPTSWRGHDAPDAPDPIPDPAPVAAAFRRVARASGRLAPLAARVEHISGGTQGGWAVPLLSGCVERPDLWMTRILRTIRGRRRR